MTEDTGSNSYLSSIGVEYYFKTLSHFKLHIFYTTREQKQWMERNHFKLQKPTLLIFYVHKLQFNLSPYTFLVIRQEEKLSRQVWMDTDKPV